MNWVSGITDTDSNGLSLTGKSLYLRKMYHSPFLWAQETGPQHQGYCGFPSVGYKLSGKKSHFTMPLLKTSK